MLTSASASTQTILPTARTSLSMAAFKAIPTRFARIHPNYLTPTDSTIWMGVVSIIFYVGLTLVSQNILADTIAPVGLMIAFYYGLIGFACVWFYRKTMWDKPRDIIMQGVIPLVGSVLLLGAFIIGIGSLLVGVVLMFVYQTIAPSYFRGDTCRRVTPASTSSCRPMVPYRTSDSRTRARCLRSSRPTSRTCRLVSGPSIP